MADEPWTLDGVAKARPDLEPLVRIHLALAATASRVQEELDNGSFHPVFSGAPALHWVEGTPLFDGCDPAPLDAPLATLFDQLAATLAATFPDLDEPVQEMRAAARDGLPWRTFREPSESLPHPPLFRFLLFRTVAVPVAHLARSVSPPHAERWFLPRCPYCGVPAAAQVAAAGSNRTLLCVLCGGRWKTEDLSCVSCGDADPRNALVMAHRDAGPASLEACATCKMALKVFPGALLEPGAPLACEILTVGLDLLAEHQEGIRRHETAMAAVFPPR